MTKPIKREFDSIRVSEDDDPQPSPELRPASLQRGRGAGGEEDDRAVASLSFRAGPTLPGLISRFLLHATRSLSHAGGSGTNAGTRRRLLEACLWMLLGSVSSTLLAQAKKVEKPTEQPAAQQQPIAERRNHVQKVFPIKHADVNSIGQTLRIFPVEVRETPNLRVIAVSGPPALMPTIEETIRRLDVPRSAPQNIELTVYLILASDNATDSLPLELEGVAKQLKTTFGFKALHGIDTLVVRSRDKQGADAHGLARFDTDIPNPSTYSLAYRAASIFSDEKGRSIRLDGLRFAAKVVVKSKSEASSSVVGYPTIDAGFGTDIDVREGQKVVVGKAAVGGTNSALILVITAKVLE